MATKTQIATRNVEFQLQANTFTRTGYSFVGWNEDWNSSQIQYTDESHVTFPEDKDLYAIWKVNQYTITFDAAGGTGGWSRKQDYGTEIVAPTVTRRGYTFQNWEPSVLATVPANNVTYIAQWNVVSYTITWVMNGHGEAPSKISYTIEESYQFPTNYVVDGYTFNGWVDQNGNSITKIEQGTTGNLTISAQWGVVSYDIEYKMNGHGTMPSSARTTYTIEDTPYTPPTPENPIGYTFQGWAPQSIAEGATGDQTFNANWTPIEYTITYNTNGHGSISSDDEDFPTSYTIESEVIVPRDLSVEGYTFNGWNPTRIPTGTTGDQTFNATWSANEYTVTFNANGGNPPTFTKEVTYDSTYGDLPTPLWTGYNFNHWWTSADGGSQITSYTRVTNASDHQIYAHWTLIEYTITWDMNGHGTAPSKTTYTIEDEEYVLPTPAASGYTFNGWIDGNGDTITSIPAGSTGDITLQAQWIRVYTIKWYQNIDNAGDDSTLLYTWNRNENTELGPLPSTTLDGFVFWGWYDRPGISGVEDPNAVQILETTQVTRNANYYAWWKRVDDATITFRANWPVILTYNSNLGSNVVSFDSMGGTSVESMTVANATEIGTLPTTTRDAYNFVGWYTLPNGDGTPITEQTVVHCSFVCYACWDPVKYTITYNLDGGEVSDANPEEYYVTTETFTLNNPTKTGYEFNGWSEEGDDSIKTTVTITKGSTGNRSFIANWNLTIYTITWNMNGHGTMPSSARTTYTIEDADYVLPIPSASGYTFNGWVDQNGNSITKIEQGTTGDRKFQANWTAKSYTVTFGKNQGNDGSDSVTVIYGEDMPSIAVPTRSGYTFGGYWTTVNTGGVMYYNADGTSAHAWDKTSDTTLWAKWLVNAYTWNINLDNNVQKVSLQYTYQEESKTDQLTSSGTVQADFNSSLSATATPKPGYYISPSTTVTETMTTSGVQTSFTATAYTVTYDERGGSVVSDASGVVTLPTTTRVGYTFDGWYTADSGGTKVGIAGSSYTPTKNITLYAHWNVVSYTITYDMAGHGTMPSSARTTYTIEDTPYTPPTPENPIGYTFQGWVPQSIAEGTTGDQTFQANWELNTYTVTFNGNFPTTYATTPLSFSYAVPSSLTKNVGDPVGTLGTVGDEYSGPGGEGHHIIPDNASLQQIAWKFLGWYTAVSGGTEVTDSTAFSGDTTVYAHWERRLYIRFNRQYGETGDARYVYQFFIDMGKTVGQGFESGVLPTITRSGYTLLGWYSAQDPEPRKANNTYPKPDSDGKLHYMVKYENDGGTASSNLRKIYVSSNTADDVSFTEGSVTGNTVKVWDSGINDEVNMGGVPRANEFIPTSSTILYAHWAANPYTVTWNANGGSSVPAYSRSYGMEVGDLPSSTKAGYTLDGWFTAATGGTQITSDTIVTGNVTYYAHWTTVRYTVTVSAGEGGSDGSSIGYSISTSPQTKTFTLPTRTGYSISSWTIGAGYTGTKPSISENTLTIPKNTYGDFTVTPTWDVNTYTWNITLGSNVQSVVLEYTNKGTATTKTITASETVQADYNTGLTASATPSAGYYISTTNHVTATMTTSGVTTSFSAEGYKVTYDEQDGSVVPDRSGVVTLPETTRTGYTFSGWYTEASGGTKVGDAGSSYTPTKNITLYAHWTAVRYSLTLDQNGGSEGFLASSSYTISTSAQTVGITAPTYTGRHITAWTVTGATSGSPTVTSTTTSTLLTIPEGTYGSLTVKPTWAFNTYTVTFDANGGSVSTTTKSVTYASTYGELPAPTRTGYSFLGWYTDASGGNRVTASTTVAITSGQTLYAHWSVNSYTIVFDLNGGGVRDSDVVDYDTWESVDAPTRTGYVFAGWIASGHNTSVAKYSPSYNVAVDMAIDPFVVTSERSDGSVLFKSLNKGGAGDSSTTVTAQWTPITYTVTFDANGGSGNMGSQQFTYGTAQNLTTNTFSRTGYTFAGWATSSNGNVEYENGDSVSNLTSEDNGTVTLYAVWSINTYTVTLHANESVVPDAKFDDNQTTCTVDNVTYGQNYPTLPCPHSTGYTISSWYDSGTDTYHDTDEYGQINETVDITRNSNFWAQWNANTYTLKLSANNKTGSGYDWSTAQFSDGSKSKNVTATYGAHFPTLQVPSCTAREFDYWYATWTDSSGSSRNCNFPRNEGGQIDSNVAFDAKNSSIITLWAQYTMIVSFDVNGGSAQTDLKRNVGRYQQVGSLPDSNSVSRTGYTLEGWYTEATGGTKILSNTIVTSDVSYYAHWNVVSYTITWNMNGHGTAPSQTSYTIEDEEYVLPTPSASGYIFNGWQDGSGNTVTSIPAGSTGDITLQAQWIRYYKFNANSNPINMAIAPRNTSSSLKTVFNDVQSGRYKLKFTGLKCQYYRGDDRKKMELVVQYMSDPQMRVYTSISYASANDYSVTPSSTSYLGISNGRLSVTISKNDGWVGPFSFEATIRIPKTGPLALQLTTFDPSADNGEWQLQSNGTLTLTEVKTT